MVLFGGQPLGIVACFMGEGDMLGLVSRNKGQRSKLVIVGICRDGV